MKKMLLLVCLSFTIMASGQIEDGIYHQEESMKLNTKFDFNEERNNLCFGLHIGTSGHHQGITKVIALMSVSYKGFYFDIGGMPAIHSSDVRVDKWNDSRAFLTHIGYSVPVASFLRITPLVGYSMTESGITNGYDWRYDSNGIYNKFEKADDANGFDYGGQLTININRFNIHATYTKYSWYFGIGFDIPIK